MDNPLHTRSATFDARGAALGAFAFAGVATFTLVCGAAQFLRPDLDWLRAPLSYYLVGPGAIALKAAYVILSASLAAIALGFYRALEPQARSAAPLLLFVLAGVALTVVALADTGTKPGEYSTHAFVHNVAAAATFNFTTVAMLLQSWRLRGDPRWRGKFAVAFGLAAAAFVALWIYALSHLGPRGLVQKIVIVLILAWLGCAAWWVRRASGTPIGSA